MGYQVMYWRVGSTQTDALPDQSRTAAYPLLVIENHDTNVNNIDACTMRAKPLTMHFAKEFDSRQESRHEDVLQ